MAAHHRVILHWFIINTTMPSNSPIAGHVDGYYSTRENAVKAKAIMTESFKMRPQDLPIEYEGVPR